MALLHEKLTYKIRGLCYEIQKQYGGFLKEVVYHRALSEKLIRDGLKFKHEPRLRIVSLDTGKSIGAYQPDFLIEDTIIIELKAKPILSRADHKQILDYLRFNKYQVGLLVNFSPEGCTIYRKVYTHEFKKSRAGN